MPKNCACPETKTSNAKQPTPTPDYTPRGMMLETTSLPVAIPPFTNIDSNSTEPEKRIMWLIEIQEDSADQDNEDIERKELYYTFRAMSNRGFLITIDLLKYSKASAERLLSAFWLRLDDCTANGLQFVIKTYKARTLAFCKKYNCDISLATAQTDKTKPAAIKRQANPEEPKKRGRPAMYLTIAERKGANATRQKAFRDKKITLDQEKARNMKRNDTLKAIRQKKAGGVQPKAGRPLGSCKK